MSEDSAVTAAELDEIEAGLLEFGYSQRNNRKAYEAIRALRRERDEARRECDEQARLNGMGGERELALMAQIAKKDAALREIDHINVKHGFRTDINRIIIAALAPASQEADHVADAGNMVPASPSPGLREHFGPLGAVGYVKAALQIAEKEARLREVVDKTMARYPNALAALARSELREAVIEDEATVAAVANAIQGAWVGGMRQRFSDRYLDIMARAAIRALSRPVSEREGGNDS